MKVIEYLLRNSKIIYRQEKIMILLNLIIQLIHRKPVPLLYNTVLILCYVGVGLVDVIFSILRLTFYGKSA